MSGLNSTDGWAANAALTGIAVVPVCAFWALSLHRIKHRSQAMKFGHHSLRIAPPVFGLGLVCTFISSAILAAYFGDGRYTSTGFNASLYLAATGTFLIVAGQIMTTMAVYLSGLAILYISIGKPKLWKLLRIDASVGVALLLILDIAYWGRTMADLKRTSASLAALWLMLIIDVVQCLLAMGTFSVAIYSYYKFKSRTELPTTNVPVLFLVASFLWFFRCLYASVIDIKTIIPDWVYDELQAQKIIYPLLDLWVTVATLAILTMMLRRELWTDANAFPDEQTREVQQQPAVVIYPNGVVYMQQGQLPQGLPPQGMPPQGYVYGPQQGQPQMYVPYVPQGQQQQQFYPLQQPPQQQQAYPPQQQTSQQPAYQELHSQHTPSPAPAPEPAAK